MMNREIKFMVFIPSKEFMGVPFDPFDNADGGLFPSDAVFLQYTGLLCHGDEVYEGFLLKRTGSNMKKNSFVVGKVCFKNGAFVIEWAQKDNGWNDSLYNHLPDCEIIGNIYENPELLK